MKLYFDNDEFQKAIKEAARKRAHKIINDPARDDPHRRVSRRPFRTHHQYTTAPTSGPRTSSCDHHSEVTSLAYSMMRAR
ncbi:MAG: hypothetical protein LH603_02795 [Pseudonocardia sp.]|nr:hypothetical protein [Pseudonocardia sp.]